MTGLCGVLLKKQEVETARSADFEFRLRARTMRLLEAALGFEAGSFVAQIAEIRRSRGGGGRGRHFLRQRSPWDGA